MDRRTFTKLLGSGIAVTIAPSTLTQPLFASGGGLYKSYERLQLVDAAGMPIKAGALKTEVPYVFMYPYVSTPCFIIALPQPSEKEVKLSSEFDEHYVWKGGVGKENTIVGYCAICAHALTHPTPEDSFITYVPKGTASMAHQEGGVIVCSSHLSVYDPAQGAKNISGVAQEPLASVILEYDAATDYLYAAGILGPERFHDFFRTFKPQLAKRFTPFKKAQKLISFSIPTVPLTEYTKDVIVY